MTGHERVWKPLPGYLDNGVRFEYSVGHSYLTLRLVGTNEGR